jgi:hypothetical protein
MRYTLWRGFERTVQIVQVDWPYGNEETVYPPMATIAELAFREGAWRLVERRDAPMQPRRYNQLLNNVAAVAGVIGHPRIPGEGVEACSHSPRSRIEISVPYDRLRIEGGAHCASDAPAFAAGALLTEEVEFSVRIADSWD